MLRTCEMCEVGCMGETYVKGVIREPRRLILEGLAGRKPSFQNILHHLGEAGVGEFDEGAVITAVACGVEGGVCSD